MAKKEESNLEAMRGSGSKDPCSVGQPASEGREIDPTSQRGWQLRVAERTAQRGDLSRLEVSTPVCDHNVPRCWSVTIAGVGGKYLGGACG